MTFYIGFWTDVIWGIDDFRNEIMTCADQFKLILSNNILSIFSYIGEGFCILSVVMIMIAFLGAEGRITRKTFTPVIVMVGIITGINSYCIIHDYIVLRKVWTEPYIEGMVHLTDKENIKWLIYSMVMGVIIITALTTFTKRKELCCIMNVFMIVFYESFISTEMLCSAMYFTENPREYVLKFKITDQLLGTTESIVFTTSYLVIMLLLFLALYLGMIKKQRTLYVKWKNRIIFIVWELIMTCIIQIPVWGDFEGPDQIRYMKYELGAILPVMGFAVPVLMIAIILRRYILEKTLIQEDYISAELDYINQYKKNQEETRAFRHDIINNLSMISSMHERKNYDEAKAYLNTLLGNVKALSPKYNTGDEMLDCIVRMKVTKMEEVGIEFQFDGAVDGGLGMKAVDVCSIFANAFDNAIEACERLPETAEKWVKLIIKRTDKFFSITLSNTMSEDENEISVLRLLGEGGRVTSKKEKSLHGFGTENMRNAIRKYDGIQKIDINEGVFTLSVMIPRKMMAEKRG